MIVGYFGSIKKEKKKFIKNLAAKSWIKTIKVTTYIN